LISILARIDRRALLGDIACVLAMVIIGTRNHDTDTGISGVAYVAAPFLIGLAIAHVMFVRASADTRDHTSGTTAVAVTVLVGMLLRNVFFGRGTAPAFIIVATVFLGATMMGWRAVSRSRRR
jgi:LytS/YehU family sensor histidine kinase